MPSKRRNYKFIVTLNHPTIGGDDWHWQQKVDEITKKLQPLLCPTDDEIESEDIKTELVGLHLPKGCSIKIHVFDPDNYTVHEIDL